MSTTWVTLLVLSLSLTACGADSTPRTSAPSSRPALSAPPATTTPSSPPTDSPSTSTPPRPGTVLRDWRREAIELNTGQFTSELGRPVIVRDDGTFQLSPMVGAYTRYVTDAQGRAVTLMAYANADDTWFNETTDGGRDFEDCWARVDPGLVEDELGLDVGSAPDALPPAVEVLGYAEVKRYGETTNEIEATTNLYTLTSMLGSQAAAELAVPASSGARAPIEIRLQDFEIVGWSAEVDDILEAASSAGFDSDRLTPGANAGVTLTVTVATTGEKLLDKPPPADRVFEVSADEAISESRLEDCIAR